MHGKLLDILYIAITARKENVLQVFFRGRNLWI